MHSQFYTPHLKEVRPLNFLYFRTKTRLNDLGRFVGIVARDLYRDAVFGNIEVTGPVYWNYTNFEGNGYNPFILEIALPIAEIPLEYSGKFHLKRTLDFHCMSLVHAGSWYDIPKSYERLIQFAGINQFKLTGQNREIYINIDFTSPQSNVTELQVGVAFESTGVISERPFNSHKVENSLAVFI